MGAWMRSVNMLRAYTVSTLVYTVPIFLGSLALVFYMSAANHRVDDVQQQVNAAAVSGKVQPREVTASVDYNDLIPEWALIILLAALGGGTYTRRRALRAG